MIRPLLLLVIAGCGVEPVPSPGGGDMQPALDESELDETQVPPQGRAAIEAWLANGHYLGWQCEPEPHPARPPGAHGSNRICSNDALSASTDGAFPIGAASVKELYRDGEQVGFAVARKTSAGWYWYEGVGQTIYADSVGAGLCMGCHADAPRDHVFTQVR